VSKEQKVVLDDQGTCLPSIFEFPFLHAAIKVASSQLGNLLSQLVSRFALLFFKYLSIRLRYFGELQLLEKYRFFSFLFCVAFYLAAYSPLHITAALVINIYLIIYVLYKLIKKLMSNSQWHKPCIIRMN